MCRHLDRDFGREQAEQSRELDDGVHGYGGGILEGVAYRVADDRCRMERRALFLQVDFDHFLRVVPRAAGVGHVDGLKEAEAGDGNQIGDEEVRVQQREGERDGNQCDEDVPHPLLRILGADPDNRLGILDIGFRLVQVHRPFNELDRPVRAGGDRLHGGAGEPEDHRAAADQAENDRRVGQLHLQHVLALEQQDDREDHGRGAANRSADEHGFGRRLEGVSGPVVRFEVEFTHFEIGSEPEVPLDLFLDAGDVFGLRQLEDGLGVVGHRTVAVDGDVDRAHAEESVGHQTEGEDRRIVDDFNRYEKADEVRDTQEEGDQHAHVEGAEVAGDDTGQDGQGCAALTRCGHDLLHVFRFGAGEYLGELGDEHRRQRTATDDHGKLPPDMGHGGQHAVFDHLEVTDEQVAPHKRSGDAEGGCDPDQSHERLFEIELFLAAVFGRRNGLVHEVRNTREEVHQEAHGENPDDQFALDGFFDRAIRTHNGQRDKGYQRNAGDAIGLETVCRGAHAVARVVTGTVGDDARVSGIVFLRP